MRIWLNDFVWDYKNTQQKSDKGILHVNSIFEQIMTGQTLKTNFGWEIIFHSLDTVEYQGHILILL